MGEQIKTIEDEGEVLRDRIIQLEKEIQQKTITYFSKLYLLIFVSLT
jgi:hypothetical protein